MMFLPIAVLSILAASHLATVFSVPLPDISCDTYTGSCEHYAQCVEPLLECGESGFTLAYGRRHCEIIQQLESNVSSVPTWMTEWMRSHEMCLQQKVFELATAQECPSPDPLSCLQFELSALAAFEECFTRNISLLCNSNELINNSSNLAEQISNVTQLLGINEYYSKEIVKMIAKAINSTCTHPNTHHIISSIRPSSTKRIIFCAVVAGDASVAVSSYAGIVAQELNRSEEQFRYAGLDQQLCAASAPAAIGNFPNLEFHYVMWEPESTDPLPDTLEDTYSYPVGVRTFFEFYDLDDLSSYGHCGDGLRQAGELCDTGVMNLIGMSGCNNSCMPHDQFECDTTPLVMSMCRGTTCGDGMRTSNEECDDGNDLSGDGCSDCHIVDGYECTSPYNDTSSCSVIPIVPTSIVITTSSQTRNVITSTVTSTSTPKPTELPVGGSASSLNYYRYSILLSLLLVLLMYL